MDFWKKRGEGEGGIRSVRYNILFYFLLVYNFYDYGTPLLFYVEDYFYILLPC